MSDSDKIYGLSLFWQEVNYNFANFELVPDLDWDRSFREAIPRVLATNSTLEYYRELQRFCALLKDGHTNVFFPDSIVQNYFDYPSMLLREIDRRAFVANLDSSLAHSIPIGSEIVAVDGVGLREYMRTNVFPYISFSTDQMLWEMGVTFNAYGFGLLAGSLGSTVELTVVTPGGEQRRIKVARDNKTVVHRPFFPASPSFPLVEYESLPDELAYVALNSFGTPAVIDEFKALFPKLYGARGLIIDLRKNTGGSTANCKPIATCLTADKMIGSATRTRKHIAAFKAWADLGDPQYSAFAGRGAWESEAPDTLAPEAGPKLNAPVVILIGRCTASAAEDFLVYLDRVENVTLVGEPTCGSTGQPLIFDLPGGGKARVCAKHDSYPDGRDFVGCGIQPDVFVRAIPEDILDGCDRVRARALEILKQKVSGRR